ncbi:MAG: phenylalanine--tRNA ligase subunit beta [Erysipelotrichaceae bacterium]|nr:phenylalanine--tRNA ligase subunit beta [Erysipelotrichaceae bacterium]
MKYSYNWLKEYVDLKDINVYNLAEKMTAAGMEVEAITPLASGTNLVIGEIIDCQKHQDSDHLHVCKVDIKEEVLQIVCGAKNARTGLKVIVAKVGAKLPNIEIKKAKLRGVESFGMLCSLKELGVNAKYLSEHQLSGIEELPEDALVGNSNVLEYLGYDDFMIDVGLTPNRSDCNGIFNMAKEIGAILNRKVTLPSLRMTEYETKSTFKVDVLTEACHNFLAKVIHHIEIKESPLWMKRHLEAVGIKSINNIVDISNYVMLETGQPLHFYDLNIIHDHLVVKDNYSGSYTALDGNSYQIEKEDIMIFNQNKPVGIAGIMGGDDSKITMDTKGIVIEAASFHPVNIRKTSKRLNLFTESSTRFTKGIDLQALNKAMLRSVDLLVKYAGAKEIEETVWFKQDCFTPTMIETDLTYINGLLGTSFSKEEVHRVLEALDFYPQWNQEVVTCKIPSYRSDIKLPADIAEEVIRLIGFDSLQATMPTMEATVGLLNKKQQNRRLIRNFLSSSGLNEIVTYTLINQEYASHNVLPFDETVALLSPMSNERKFIRNSLINSVLECASYNVARKNNHVNLFEISNVYGTTKVKERLAIYLSNYLHQSRLFKMEVKVDFYVLKGLLVNLFKKMGYEAHRVSFKVDQQIDVNIFHPYRVCNVYVDDVVVGCFGQIHPEYASQFDLEEVYYAEINLDDLYKIKTDKVQFKAIDKYPSVKRDIALVCKDEVSAKELMNCIEIHDYVCDVEIFDIYRGNHVEDGYKSVAIALTYQANDHTLQEEEINEVHNQILENLKHKVNAVLRG